MSAHIAMSNLSYLLSVIIRVMPVLLVCHRLRNVSSISVCTHVEITCTRSAVIDSALFILMRSGGASVQYDLSSLFYLGSVTIRKMPVLLVCHMLGGQRHDDFEKVTQRVRVN